MRTEPVKPGTPVNPKETPPDPDVFDTTSFEPTLLDPDALIAIDTDALEFDPAIVIPNWERTPERARKIRLDLYMRRRAPVAAEEPTKPTTTIQVRGIAGRLTVTQAEVLRDAINDALNEKGVS